MTLAARVPVQVADVVERTRLPLGKPVVDLEQVEQRDAALCAELAQDAVRFLEIVARVERVALPYLHLGRDDQDDQRDAAALGEPMQVAETAQDLIDQPRFERRVVLQEDRALQIAQIPAQQQIVDALDADQRVPEHVERIDTFPAQPVAQPGLRGRIARRFVGRGSDAGVQEVVADVDLGDEQVGVEHCLVPAQELVLLPRIAAPAAGVDRVRYVSTTLRHRCRGV